MGFVGFLKFAFKCFDLLAWPLFGLGCPLYASIRAIENNSNSEMRNLVAYWILFSLVSLFELAFVKLIQWLPFWSYMKLMAMCLLVLPDFNGAYYVYECLLRPCLFVDLRAVMKYFIRPKEDKSFNTENFLAMTERYVQENGSEALEKLLDLKSMHTKPDIGVEEIKAMTNTEEKETAAAIQPKHTKPDIGMEEIMAMTITGEKETPVAIQSKYEELIFGEIDARAVEQPEKTPLAATKLARFSTPLFQSNHTKPDIGREEIKAMTSTEEKETPVAIQFKNEELIFGEVDTRAVEQPEKMPVAATKLSQVKEPSVGKENANTVQLKDKNPAVATEQVKRVELNLAQTEKKTVAAGEIKEKTVGTVDGENKAVEITDSEKVQREWTCALCQVTTTCEKNLHSHLQGRRHMDKCQELKASMQMNKTKGSSSSAASPVPKKILNVDRPFDNQVQVNRTNGKCREKFSCSICDVKLLSETDLASHLRGNRHLSNAQQHIEYIGCGMNKLKFSCSICDVKLISEIDLAAHLRGIRHLTNTQQRNDNLGGGWYY